MVMNVSLHSKKPASTAETTSAATVDTCETLEVSQRVWRTCAAAILIIGAVLRLYDLNLVPLHHDEGVNGIFLRRLVSDGFYQYDPLNYHGPTLYYFAALIPWISKSLFGKSFAANYGLSTFTIRFVTAAFGVATIWLVLTLRRRIGTIAALAGAVLLAISPGAVYLSRYFIHEPLLVFFSLALVVATLRFYESLRLPYLLLAATSAALLFATKETAFITVGVLLIALVSSIVLARLRETNKGRKKSGKKRGEIATLREQLRFTIERFGGLSSLAILSVAALSLFLTIAILFYSSFFTNYPKGLYDALQTFDVWAKTGTRIHVKPWWTYVAWMLKKESPVMVLGLLGVVLAIWRGSNRLAVFTALWAVGIFAAYSLIPYKTPWLLLNLVAPLAIIGGYAFQEIYKKACARKQSFVAMAIAVLALAISSYQALLFNFVHYDDEQEVYVYVHTRRDIFPLLAEVDKIAKRAGTGEQSPITITSSEYWPFPWYLRRYPFVQYGKTDLYNEVMIIGPANQQLQLEASIGSNYVQIRSGLNPAGTYTLRPGVELVLFARRDLASQVP
jgi:uncharacterized protein (TIGR03663 family)